MPADTHDPDRPGIGASASGAGCRIGSTAVWIAAAWATLVGADRHRRRPAGSCASPVRDSAARPGRSAPTDSFVADSRDGDPRRDRVRQPHC